MWGISFIIAVEVIKGISSSPHDPVKFFEVKHTVAISVGLLKHFLELIIRNLLSDLTGDSLEVFEGDLVEVVLVEELEDLEDFFLGVSWALDKQAVTILEVMMDENSLKFMPYLSSLPSSA